MGSVVVECATRLPPTLAKDGDARRRSVPSAAWGIRGRFFAMCDILTVTGSREA